MLCGIIFVLKTGIQWDDLPAELGLGYGRNCRETLAAWQEAGVWQRPWPAAAPSQEGPR